MSEQLLTLTLLQQADLLGRERYVELSLAELLGSAASQAEDPAMVVLLNGLGQAHRYRAHLIEAEIPISLGLPHTEEVTVAPSPAHERQLVDLAALAPLALAAVVIGEWYPAIFLSYQTHQALCSEAGDPPIVRLLDRLLDDLGRIRDAPSVAAWNRETADARDVIDALGGPFGTLVN